LNLVQLIVKLNARFLRLVMRLSRQRLLLLFVAFVIINCLCQLIILYFLPTDFEHPSEKYTLFKQFIMVVIVGPIVETLLFQILILRFILKKITQIEIIAVVLSAILFGLWHSDNITLIAAGFVSGLTLAILFFVFRQKKWSPFLYLTLIHGGFNLVALVINNILLG